MHCCPYNCGPEAPGMSGTHFPRIVMILNAIQIIKKKMSASSPPSNPFLLVLLVVAFITICTISWSCAHREQYSRRDHHSFVLSHPSAMRFRFCGDLDCPDWILVEIATLSELVRIHHRQPPNECPRCLCHSADLYFILPLYLDSLMHASIIWWVRYSHTVSKDRLTMIKCLKSLKTMLMANQNSR